MNDGGGVIGVASDANWGVGAITVGEWPDVPHYFQEAIDNLNAGDVWLIELQMYPPGRDATPMEWLQGHYYVIWTGRRAQGAGHWREDGVEAEAGRGAEHHEVDAVGQGLAQRGGGLALHVRDEKLGRVGADEDRREGGAELG